jgi:hypothetical protein
MTVHLAKTSRAEQVRRRRQQQQSRRRFDTAARATTAVRPLISHPRRNPATAGTVTGRFGSLRHRSFRATVEDLIAFRVPWLSGLRPSWRLASLSLLLLLGTMLVRLLSDPRMYVNGINLGGSALVPGEAIYARSGVAGQHIFWVDPIEVQRRVAAVPGIASASVDVRWPNVVTILVTEHIPVVLWVEGESHWWVDADGQKWESGGDLPGLLPVTVDAPKGTAAEQAAQRVPAAAIRGALQLRQLRPNIELLHYDPLHGLSYQDGRGWRGYFGMGTDMAQKLAVYERLTADLTARGIVPQKISVENLAAPYYLKCPLWPR